MHLRDRGGGDRFAEADEDAVDRPPEGRLDRRDRHLARKRRHAVLQQLQMAHHIGADDIRPRRQKLAELHIGRSERADRGGQIAQAALRAAGGGIWRSAWPAPSGGRAAGGINIGSMSLKTPARARTKPARVRRNMEPREKITRGLKLPAGMDGDDAAGQPGEVGALEPRLVDLFAKLFGAGKARIDSTR